MSAKTALTPTIGLLCKLGSLLIHLEEGSGEGNHQYDWAAIDSIQTDPEIQEWLKAMDAMALLPKKR